MSIRSTLAGCCLLLSGCAAAPYPPSDHYDGRQFISVADHTFAEEVKWLWEMETVEWPAWIEDPVLPAPPSRVDVGIRAAYVGQATVLVQMDGLNVVTDPVWSDRAGPLPWLGSPRIRRPGLSFDDLPSIGAVLIRHNHYDHLDLPTLRAIAARDNPVVVCGLGNRPLLLEAGFTDVRELDWWHATRIGTVNVTFVPAQHLSGRGLFDANRTLWGGFLLDGRAGRVYFAGDTGYGPLMEQVVARSRPVDLALLPIGSYEKRWFMQRMHLNPDDAVRLHLALQARRSIGIHFATFAEHPEQSIDAHAIDLAAALKAHNVEPATFVVPAFGEGVEREHRAAGGSVRAERE